MEIALIAPAQIDARDRVLRAAVGWVYDQGCASALAELEDAVCEMIGRNIDGSLIHEDIKSPTSHQAG